MQGQWKLTLLSCVLTLSAGLAFAPASYDDGYITYRYAQNLASGAGFVFNPGEHVFGTSAPGYAISLAFLATVLRPISCGVDVIGSLLFLTSLALLPLLAAGIARRVGSARAVEIGGVLAVLAIPSRWNLEMMGCEQMPILALIAISVMLALDSKTAAAGLCAGLAGAFRFDAGLAIAGLAVFLWIERRRVPWKFALSAALPVLACWCWLLWEFGSILPTTLAGKRAEVEFATQSYLLEEVAWLIRTSGKFGATFLSLMAILGLASCFRLRSRAALLASCLGAAAISYECFYHWIGVPFAPWYQIATLNGIYLLAALGIVKGLLALSRATSWPNAGAIAGAIAASLVSLSSVPFFLEAAGRPPDPRIRIYRDVALAVKDVAGPGQTTASVEVGALAYFSERPILDLAGLLSAATREARQTDRLAVYLQNSPPDFFIDNPTFHSNFLKQVQSSGMIASAYAEVASFSRPEYPHVITLFARRPEPILLTGPSRELLGAEAPH